MLRNTLDTGIDDTMISPPKHNPCIYKVYNLVEEIDINKTQIDVKMTTVLRERKYTMPSVHIIEGSGLV